MAIKFKLKENSKVTIEARDLVQARAIQKHGFEPATKEDAAKLKPQKKAE